MFGELHASEAFLQVEGKKRRASDYNEDVYSPAHVTCSKLKPNCTNPSQSCFSLFYFVLSSRTLSLIIIPFSLNEPLQSEPGRLSGKFVCIFQWHKRSQTNLNRVVHVQFSVLINFSDSFLIPSLFYYFIFFAFQACVLSFLDSLMPSRHWRVLSRLPFDWVVFITENMLRSWRKTKKKTTMRKDVLMNGKLATSH